MRPMLLAAVFALAFHGWLLSSQFTWLLPETPAAALRRSVRISLTPAPAKTAAPVKSAAKKEEKPPPVEAPRPAAEKKPAPPAKTEKPPAPKPAPAVQENTAEAPPPEPAPKPPPIAVPPPPTPFSSLFDSVKSSSREPLIPEGLAAISTAPETAPDAEATAPAGAVDSGGPDLTEARPLYRQNPPPDYPRLARRRGYQGTVLLDVLVDKTGRARDVKVDESCGHGSLDRAAKKAVKGWRFEPGRRGDDPVDMRVKVPVRFELK